MTRAELLAALLVERYTSPWWTATSRQRDAEATDDSEIKQAQRRRLLAADYERAERSAS